MKTKSVPVNLPPYLSKLVGSYAKDHGVSSRKFLEHALTLETFYGVLEEASDLLDIEERSPERSKGLTIPEMKAKYLRKSKKKQNKKKQK